MDKDCLEIDIYVSVESEYHVSLKTNLFFLYHSAPTITHELNNYIYPKVIRLCVRMWENKFHSADFASFRSRSQQSIYVSNPRKGLNNFQKENLLETFFPLSLKLCFPFFRFSRLTTQQTSNSHLLLSIQVLWSFCVRIPQPGKLWTFPSCKDFSSELSKNHWIIRSVWAELMLCIWTVQWDMFSGFECTAWNLKSCSFHFSVGQSVTERKSFHEFLSSISLVICQSKCQKFP